MENSCKNIEDLIPQGPPIVMVDGLIEKAETYTISSFEIKDNNVFVKDGFFKEPGIVENIAQTAALGTGYEACINNTEPKIGFIGAIKNLEIFSHPKVGDQLNTKVSIEHQVFNATIIEGVVNVGDTKIASCQMKIFLIEEEK